MSNAYNTREWAHEHVYFGPLGAGDWVEVRETSFIAPARTTIVRLYTNSSGQGIAILSREGTLRGERLTATEVNVDRLRPCEPV